MTNTEIFYAIRQTTNNWLTIDGKHYTLLNDGDCLNGNTHMLLVQVIYTSIKLNKTRIKILQAGLYGLTYKMPRFNKKHYSIAN